MTWIKKEKQKLGYPRYISTKQNSRFPFPHPDSCLPVPNHSQFPFPHRSFCIPILPFPTAISSPRLLHYHSKSPFSIPTLCIIIPNLSYPKLLHYHYQFPFRRPSSIISIPYSHFLAQASALPFPIPIPNSSPNLLHYIPSSHFLTHYSAIPFQIPIHSPNIMATLNFHLKLLI